MHPMTRFAAVLFVLGVTACGGGAPKSVTGPGVPGGGGEVADPIPATKGPDCAVVADKLATVAHAETPDRQPEARDKLRIRCTDDKWSDEARSCFATVETDAEIDGCAKMLTDAQRGQLDMASPDKPIGAPAPPPPAADKPKGGRGTRGATQRNSSDPCEGGEAKSDPCEGGERK